MSRNDITGDKLISKVSNENFNKGYDQIDWSKKGKTCSGECKKNSSDGHDHQCCNTGSLQDQLMNFLHPSDDQVKL